MITSLAAKKGCGFRAIRYLEVKLVYMQGLFGASLSERELECYRQFKN